MAMNFTTGGGLQPPPPQTQNVNWPQGNMVSMPAPSPQPTIFDLIQMLTQHQGGPGFTTGGGLQAPPPGVPYGNDMVSRPIGGPQPMPGPPFMGGGNMVGPMAPPVFGGIPGFGSDPNNPKYLSPGVRNPNYTPPPPRPPLQDRGFIPWPAPEPQAAPPQGRWRGPNKVRPGASPTAPFPMPFIGAPPPPRGRQATPQAPTGIPRTPEPPPPPASARGAFPRRDWSW